MSLIYSIPQAYHNRVLFSKHHRDFDFNHNADMDTLAERLRQERDEHGLTQGQLADKVSKLSGQKMGQSHIGNLESGSRKSSTRLPEIAAALGVSALWLATGKGPKTLTAYSERSLELAAQYMDASDEAKSAIEYILSKDQQAKM